MNKVLRLEGGPYQPISRSESRLPASYNFGLSDKVAAGQVTAMFSHVGSEEYCPNFRDLAESVAKGLQENAVKDRKEWVEKLAAEFSIIRD